MIICPLDENFRTHGPVVKNCSSMVYTDRWEDHSAFEAVVKDSYFAQLNAAAWLLVDDRIFEIEEIADVKKKRGLIKISGPGLTNLLHGVAITEIERLRGNLEERIRYLITKYALSGDQQVTRLVLEPLVGYARAMDVTTKLQQLDEFLFSALNERGFSYSIEYDPDEDELVFHLLQGKDRTQGQSLNDRVLFTENEKNLDNFTYQRTNMGFFNAAMVSDEADPPTVVFVDQSLGARKRILSVPGKKAAGTDDGTVPLFVLAGYNGYIATSPDGENFTAKTSGTTQTLYGGGYSAGKFTLCGGNGTILASDDGNIWASKASGVTDALEDAYIYDGLHMVVGNAGKLLTSYDNETYTVQTVSGGVKLMTPFRGERVFVIASSNSRIYTTEDGVTNLIYRAVDTGVGSCGLNGIVVANGKIVAAGYHRNETYTVDYPIIAVGDEVSEDALAVTTFPAITGGRFTAIAFGFGVYVAIGQPNMIYWSEDLEHWYDCTPAGGTPDYISIAFDGLNFYAYSATTKHLAKSPDGKNFTLQTISITCPQVQVALYGTSSLQAGLRQLGTEALQATRQVINVAGDTIPGKKPIYKTHYNLGDVVDIASSRRDIIVSKRATEMRHVFEAGNPSVVPTFGTRALGQRQFIKKEIGIRV